jgi:lipoprotein-releasing system ATP-binding protein
MLVAEGLTKSYGALPVLRGIDLRIEPGEFVALVGTSGAGKTTLLQVLGLLDSPDAGTLTFQGTDLLRLRESAAAQFRNRTLGFVFQFHHLMAEFTALENVCIPALLRGDSRRSAESRARTLLAELGLEQRLTHKPAALSGGEQQRVAVARALVNDPKLILADEPSGNLDSANANALFNLFQNLARSRGVALLVATHNQEFAAAADRTLRIRDGRFSET